MELIISMAVFVLVAGAIMMFIYSGSRSYSFAKTEVDLQMETQTLLSQINTMILESDNAVYDAAKKTLTLYQIDTTNVKSPTSGGITVEKNLKNKKVIYFDTATSSLYLEEYADDRTPACTASEDRLLAQYIDSFQTVIDKNKVTVTLEMKNKRRSYKADVTTKMRNGLVEYP